ncbi:hypothetical protein R5W24_001494 [Gemmata sp. JC717]|uniref:hypothetical protein n=1 Tax=Gemmata algarum TaxID=2975278 RepID=UPI0021BA3E46|nr:hypothetical protein [Gemmata algarum]MDY3552412.1 hypothetical protein [Gemmata algarum]
MSQAFLDSKIEKHKLSVVEQTRPSDLRGFRDRVRKRMCTEFGNLDSLRLAVILSLNDFARDDSLPGWVRSDHAADLKIANDEITRLREEIAHLRETATKRSNADNNRNSEVISKIGADGAKLLVDLIDSQSNHLIRDMNADIL